MRAAGTGWPDWYAHSSRSTFKQIGYLLGIAPHLVDELQLHQHRSVALNTYYKPDWNQLMEASQSIGDYITEGYIEVLTSRQNKKARELLSG